ncbi:cobalt-precorrin 5A hydrolase [Loigolactobacillus jiayinensis]|uniref:Cobalt-precorrin 5A hydrolase n=1 Tax=Loigolactobacillus jiayinensis TaxID=2486016 RepID=A0ABW1RDW2_9LACO|nr:cobalt-precorrin 5A hydrolase [Loigolactobacillus jiayinensis]
MSQRFAIVTVTAIGQKLAQQIAAVWPQPVTIYAPAKIAAPTTQSIARGTFTTVVQDLFKQVDCLICIMASGIVVRTLAPVIEDKTTDPAVLVLDERGQHVISLLSGHVGGANQWTTELATLLAAEPVVTTATDTEQVQALDLLMKQLNGWYPEFKRNTKWINGLLAAGQPVALYIEPYLRTYVDQLHGFTVVADWHELPSDTPTVIISDRTVFPKRAQTVQLIPRCNVFGIGCRKNVTIAQAQQAWLEFCQQQNLAWQSIIQIASIDKKAHEPALHYLAATFNCDLTFYTAAELTAAAEHYPQSAFVKKTVGVGNVAAASAEVASGQQTITPRFASQEMTFALARLKQLEK